MKNQYIKTFKQTYKYNNNKEKTMFYRIGIVRDTEDYKYRIINLDSMAIWKHYRFETYSDAKEFIDNHPHNIDRNK